jgi:hypothetical protein
MDFDFTQVAITNADGPDVAVDNTPWADEKVDVKAYFGELASPLCCHIAQSSFVVGCCAWLTHERVIESLAGVWGGCQIICQKEDFLRPDASSARGWKSRLHSLYSSLSCRVGRHECAKVALMPELSTGMDEGQMLPVRCVGNHNSDRHPAFPRMHHKFLVFCDVLELDGEDPWYRWQPKPRAVWTGSFNPTANGTRSRENAILVEGDHIALAYFREWYQMFALSEPLEWESEWCHPEYRIGT